MYVIERRLARAGGEVVHSPPALRRRRGDSFERPTEGDFVPPDEQWRAVTNAIEHRISILTGLPGTGKTQTMRALVDLMRTQKRSVRLCAPTGKAARRLGELTGARGEHDPPPARVRARRGV